MMMSRFCILFPLLEYAQFCAGNHIIFKGIFMTTSQSSSHPSTHPPTYLAPAPTAFPLALSTWSPAWSDGTPAAATKYISKCTFADKWKENPFYSLSLLTPVEKCNFKTPSREFSVQFQNKVGTVASFFPLSFISQLYFILNYYSWFLP